MTPCVVASLRVHLCEFESGVCVSRVRPYRLEYVLADSFEVINSCTWIIVHEAIVCLIAVWSKAINVEGLCLDSIGESDGFCLAMGEGAPSDVEFYEGFLECGGRVAYLRVAVRIIFWRVVSWVGYL